MLAPKSIASPPAVVRSRNESRAQEKAEIVLFLALSPSQQEKSEQYDYEMYKLHVGKYPLEIVGRRTSASSR